MRLKNTQLLIAEGQLREEAMTNTSGKCLTVTDPLEECLVCWNQMELGGDGKSCV